MVRISSVILATAGTLMFSSLSADSMMKLRFFGRSPLNTTEPTCASETRTLVLSWNSL
jgi:hypothetical protein